ncbi:MAG: hypothetical protein ABIB79_00790 [archaeon]
MSIKLENLAEKNRGYISERCCVGNRYTGWRKDWKGGQPIDVDKCIPKRVLDAQHKDSALHIYCRLVDYGMKKSLAFWTCRLWEIVGLDKLRYKALSAGYKLGILVD